MRQAWIVIALAMGLALPGCSKSPASGPAAEFGFEVLAVHLVAGGDLVQLDYRVTDYEKAKSALRGDIKIVSQDGGQGIGVMELGRLGPMKQRPVKSGSRQFMLFANTGRALKKGASAAVIFSGGRIDGLQLG